MTTTTEAKPERAWFLTLNGNQFFYDDPESYPWEVEETAHALSQVARFGAHLRNWYDVSHHSVLVARTVASMHGYSDLALLRAALAHDASESVLGDIPRPLKHSPLMAAYRALEEATQLSWMRAFGLEQYHNDPRIKHADNLMLEAEKRKLRPPTRFRQDYDERECSPVDIRQLNPEESRELFVAMWRQYGG